MEPEKPNGCVNLRIKRFDPRTDTAPRVDTFEVPKGEGWTIMTALHHIFMNADPSIAYYSSCRLGKCEACDVLVDGQLQLTCTTRLERDVTLEPLDGFVLIRDLVVDRSRPKRKSVGKLLGKSAP